MRALALLLIVAFHGLPARADSDTGPLEITAVSHHPEALAAADEGPVSISFALSSRATVEVAIYDGRNVPVRVIRSAEPLPRGAHEVVWDARDQRGTPVPPEAYVYTIRAIDAEGSEVVWDKTDDTGGRNARISDVHWNRKDHRIRYELAKASRVRIRAGLKGEGPLLATVIDWVARGPGAHEQPWDGWDASGVMNLAGHSRLAFDAQAFTLSDNAIVIGPESSGVAFLEEDAGALPRRQKQLRTVKRMFDHANTPIERRHDFPLELDLAGRDVESATISPGEHRVPVRLSVPESDREMLLHDRYEAVFFVDGLYAFETEAAFLPLVWQWDVSSLTPGDHYLSANLRGYEGYFGIATIRVRVE